MENPFEDYQMPVLKGLLESKEVVKIAFELKRPFDTVASQVKRMLHLTGTHKISELVRVATLNRWACKDCKKECPFDLHLSDAKR
jgi:DNA-binding NarL/FixJ family response regulator